MMRFCVVAAAALIFAAPSFGEAAKGKGKLAPASRTVVLDITGMH